MMCSAFLFEVSHELRQCAAIRDQSRRRDTQCCERDPVTMAFTAASSSQAPGTSAVPAEQSGAEGPTEQSVMNDVCTMLALVADALWADGPPPPRIEQQLVREKERELSRQERRGDSWQGGLGLVCMGLAEMQGDWKTKYAIPPAMGSPEFHGILAGLSWSANMMPDFTSWLEIDREPPPGHQECLGGADLGTP